MGANRWTLVLAAGSGKRVESLTLEQGRPVPKQYFRPDPRGTLLHQTLERATTLTPRERTVVIVAEDHAELWKRELADWPARNVVVQPSNRGTLAGVALPLLRIAEQDPDAVVTFMPSDHHIGNVDAFVDSVDNVFRVAESRSVRAALLGILADADEDGYGWIVPGVATCERSMGVDRFVEKPEAALRRTLFTNGALINSFVVGFRLRSMLATLQLEASEVLDPLRDAKLGCIRRAYASLPERDFSRDVLERLDACRVVVGADLDWSDLGTVPRLRAHLEAFGNAPRGVTAAAVAEG